ncbi:TonB-dependent receptor [Dysgonomonas sp. GY75]|uniref:SusC/RagA family TonB-linked outer membrane protein n=2 Tax=Dysgonomonas TaxID=156973 RepID=UPI001883D651|nr:TonB-dependent receptor [Dysgonomonas sp. GY75]MBF0647647.1 TonB-dependent receptor [Dysgonomonas sp. GY75]
MKFKVNFLNLFSLLKICMCAILLLASANLYSQQSKTEVSGVVKDAMNEAIIGASVVEKGTTNGIATDVDGSFSIKVNPNSTLVISSIGYVTQEIKVGNQTSLNALNIVLVDDSKLMDEVVVVGYGVQKKATLTGAVSAIKNEEIITTKNESVQNMLTGKVAGLRVVQNSSEPGQFSGSMDIRGLGSPLIVIDGVPRGNMARLDAEDIESISVLKDASAAIYGVNSANGVILVTTKRGEKGKVSLSYSGNVSWQMPTNFPDLANAVDWMTLFNERTMHNVDGPNRPYTDEQIEAYRNGTMQSTDWKKEVLRSSAPQTMHTLSATGGTEALSYYASIGYQTQESFLKTNAINYEKYTIRSNISSQITKNLRFDLNLAGLLDERQSSVYSSNDIIRGMWLMQPMDKVYYNETEGQYWQPTNGGLQNPVTMMNKGVTGANSYKSKWFQSNASLRYDMPFVKGLYAKGMYSYDYTLNDNKEFMKAYKLYDSGGAAKTWNGQSDAPNKVSRYFYGKDATLWNIQIGFDRQFGKHNVSAMALYENTHKEGDNFYGNRQLLLPLDQLFTGITDKMQINQSTAASSLYDYAYNAYVGRVKYDFAGKYLAEFTLRHESSSRFPDNSRWATTPGVMAAWRVSEEGFFKKSPLKFIDNLKLRGSYGRMLDDASTNDYNFLTGYYYPASGGNSTGLPSGYIFDGSFVNSSSNKGLANTAITWYKSDMLNIGLDMDAWNGFLGVTAEYFQRKRTGLLATRAQSIPGIVGAAQPQENLNSDLTRGFELELSHRNRIGDFDYQVKGNMSFTRVKTIYYEQSKRGNSYLNWRENNNDRYNNIWWGYGGDGRITNWDQIYHNPVYIGRGSTLGDYQYQDWNGDGQINDLDVHPLAMNGMTPLIYYGITISASWKGIDLTMLWQGGGKRYVAPRQFLYQPLWADTNALTQFLDRWRPSDPTASPYDPATEWISGHYAYTGTSANYNSEFNIQNGAYLRLKNIELGYTLPKKWLSVLNIQNVRVYVSSYNLLTFTKLKYMDPEFFTNPDDSKGGLGDYGYSYPLNKTVTVGMNIKF